MVYTPAEQSAAAAAVRPHLWARYAVNRPKLTCCLSLIPVIILTGIIVVTRQFRLDDPGENDYFIRNDIRTRLNDARKAARRDFEFEDGTAAVLNRADSNSNYAMSVLLRGFVDGKVPIYNDTSGDAPSVLTPESLSLLKKAEDAIIQDQDYKQYCWFDQSSVDCDGNVPHCAIPSSILNHPLLYGIEKDGEICARRNSSEHITDAQFEVFLKALVIPRNGSAIIDPKYSIFLSEDTNPQNLNSWVIQSTIYIGTPFENAVESNKQERYVSWLNPLKQQVEGDVSTDSVSVFISSATLANSIFGDIAIRDLSFAVGAIILVFIIIWFHTTSAYLAGTALLQIFLSFPFAYFFYRFVFRQDYFAALQILAIFLLLGIGADDVFVFTDAWKQAPVVLGDTDMLTRMSWTYRRAARAMSVTSITTAAAFFVTASSPIMPIGTLGLWAGLLILLQFLLVMTIYPCAVIIWERFWRKRLFVRFFRKPAEHEADYQLNLPFYQRFLPSKWRRQPDDPVRSDEYRQIERFFRGPWLRVLQRVRYSLLAFAVVIVGVAIFFAVRLEPPTDVEEFLPPDHPFNVAFDTLQTAFPVSETALQVIVRITWGLKDVDRSGTTKFDINEPGKAILDDTFDFTTAAAQQQVLNSCNFFGNQEQLVFQGETIDPVSCWIRDYAEWRKLVLGKDSFETFDSSEAQVTELLRFGNFSTPNGQLPFKRYFTGQHVALDEDRTRVVFTETRFVTSTRRAAPYSVMWPVYNEWQDLLSEFNAKGPEGANMAIATGGFAWMWQITQQKLVQSMFSGIGIMLAVAFVALTVCTMNVVVAIIAVLSIGGIVGMLLGLISLLGWDLGITESIGVVISVGYSFDGVAHIATAYVESKSESRLDRTRDAMTDLGISIMFGSLSTLFAGLMLFPAIITFFVKFAGLVVITICLSLMWALIIFPALLLIFGPTGNIGSLEPLAKTILSCLPFGKKSETPERVDEENGSAEYISKTTTESS